MGKRSVPRAPQTSRIAVRYAPIGRPVGPNFPPEEQSTLLLIVVCWRVRLNRTLVRRENRLLTSCFHLRLQSGFLAGALPHCFYL